MSEKTTREDVIEAVNNVHNLGVLYDYERWSASWDDYLNLFKTNIDGEERIRGWTVTCSGFTETQVTYGNAGRINRDYTYVIRGYFGLDDSRASEKEAMIIVEDVVETLRSSIDTDSDIEVNFPPNLTVFEARVFGDVLCHYAEITLGVMEAFE